MRRACVHHRRSIFCGGWNAGELIVRTGSIGVAPGVKWLAPRATTFIGTSHLSPTGRPAVPGQHLNVPGGLHRLE